MASTSLSLGSHWERFIQEKISSGRYGTATEVVREALRFLEERDQRLEALRTHLAQGESDFLLNDFEEGYSLDKLNKDLDEGVES